MLTLVAALLSPPKAEACIWDTDTLKDELQTHAAIFDLITGQFPHHGSGYYEWRIESSKEALDKDSEDVTARNDLAVALLKLGRFDEALIQFDKIEELSPELYETASNKGVLYKKRGEFQTAASFIERALEKKPEGHLGLGDFYLKMLGWMHSVSQGEVVEENFLGDSYESSFGCSDKDCLARLEALIRSDRRFPDALLVLGDTLFRRFDLNLALWAYVRAAELGHPRKDIIDERITKIFEHWHEADGFLDTTGVEDQETTIRRIKAELSKAQDWQVSFKKVEGELVAKGQTDFSAVEKEMLKRSIRRMVPENLGIRSSPMVFVIFGVPILAILLLLSWRRWRRRNRA